MSEFRLQKPKTIEVKDPEGTTLREFTLDVGNYDSLKAWQSKVGEIQELQKKLNEGAEDVDEIVRAGRELIEVTVGDWEWLWETMNKNVYTMLAFISHISNFIQAEIKAKTEAYL